ncbi:Zn-dependent alcohol dehydrogenase [Sphingobium sp. V4]|uniref:Zn-dependent alcohol dehydrogenase n=1 Tax=Sphingobium sp. V4 TaxID=3038927 RepID=UPI00255812B0|nr:Zn-dependent alcohol dehydrogenase [Sphingobium sp. V4]WIW89523.1 Zn-dependent alcohol dehydrogenase [Sphingobium sp. V4]
MKAAVVNALTGRFAIEEVEIDEPIGHEVLVDVRASGLCHSDLHLANHDFGVPLPAVLGHEVAGVVRAVGPLVTEFGVGDHVVGSLVQFCGVCDTCRSGQTFRCGHPEATLRDPADAPRLSRNGSPLTQAFGMGGFAEKVLIHEHQLAAIPSELPFPQAAILGCGCITGAGAVINSARVRPGDTVAIIGVGGVGLNAITGARLSGARVIIAIDIHPSKEALSRKFGATHFIDGATPDLMDSISDIVPGGVDHAFEMVGQADTTLQAVRISRVGGSVYLIGAHRPGSTVNIDVLTDIIGPQRTIKGVFMGGANIKRDIPAYADLYLQGRFNLDDLVSQTISLDEINDAYELIESGAIARSVITNF